MTPVSPLLIRKGRVIDIRSGLDGCRDLLIRGGKVARIGNRLSAGKGTRIFEAAGMIVCPGLIDMHVHLREPGFEDKETIASGSRAAAHGGFTTVACMPNTLPVHDRAEVTRMIRTLIDATAVVRVMPVAAVTRELAGAELVDFAGLRELGVVGFSNDGHVVAGSRTLREALVRIRRIGSVLIEHPEDEALSGEGVVHEGFLSRKYGLPGISSLSEDAIIQRDLAIQRQVGSRLHLTHVSTRKAKDLIQAAKRENGGVSADVTPHHLLLNDEMADPLTPAYKVKPPIRSEADRQALIRGISDGTFDCIASDHAPHTRAEKALGIRQAPFGISGVETLVPLIFDRFVTRGILSVHQMIRLLTVNPAQILGVPDRGQLRVGGDADVTVIDPRPEYTIHGEFFHSKSANSPFIGWRVRGEVSLTVVGGRIAYQGGR